jgi:Phosphoinositide 3-kinase family, accessory domain (PIK domain)
MKDPRNCLQICKFFDPLIMDNNIDVNESQRLEKPNPIVEKFYAMTREDSVSAAHLRPTQAQQIELDRIAETMDFVAMSAENKFNVWKFRYSQQKNKKMLVKFLQSVNWGQQKEMLEAMSLLSGWEQIDEEQALALLAGYFSVNDVVTHMRGGVIFTLEV